MLLPIYREHNAQFAMLVERPEFEIGTLKKFRTAYNSLKAFITYKYKTNDGPVSKITHQFISDYEFYLKPIQYNEHNTAMSQINKLKKITIILELLLFNAATKITLGSATVPEIPRVDTSKAPSTLQSIISTSGSHLLTINRRLTFFANFDYNTFKYTLYIRDEFFHSFKAIIRYRQIPMVFHLTFGSS